LATLDRHTGHPFASLVNVATDADGAKSASCGAFSGVRPGMVPGSGGSLALLIRALLNPNRRYLRLLALNSLPNHIVVAKRPHFEPRF
jgi:hypothetical protein